MNVRLPFFYWPTLTHCWLVTVCTLLLLLVFFQSTKANSHLYANPVLTTTVSEPEERSMADPVLTLTPASPVICAGGSVSLALTGCPAGGTIRWSTNQMGASISVTPTQTTSYTATCSVSGPQGTTTSATNQVTVHQPIAITAGPSTVSACEGMAVTFSVTATGSPITYAWTRNGVPVVGATSSQLSIPGVTLAQAGAYAVTVSNQCNTATSSPAQLTVSPGISISSSVTPANCFGSSTGQIFITSTGGTGPQQFQLNGQSSQTSNIFANLKVGVYQVSVKDVLGCSAQTTAEIKQPVPVVLTVKAVNAKCSGGSDGGIIVAASGGNAPYRFQINGGPLQTGESFFDLKDKATYVVTVVDGTGCATSQTAVIGAPQGFDIKATVVPAKCAGSADGTINVSSLGGTGSYQYQIGTGVFQAGTLFTGLAANTYEITVKDGNGCLGKKSVVVSQAQPLQLTATVTPVNCFGDNSGAITLKPSGGTGSVQYQLTSTKVAQASNLFKNLAQGDYTVVGTDSNGCTALLPVKIGKSDPLKIQASTVAATCCVCPTGSVALTSGGGTGTGRQFQLIGRPFQASNQFAGLSPGTYRFRVTDEVGCADSVTTIITDAASISLMAGRIKDVACTGGRDGEAAVQVIGGTKPFIYYWQTENKDTLRARTPAQTGLAEGTYTVSVLDSNRCTTTTTFVTVKALAPIPPKPVITRSSNALSVVEVTGIQWYIRVDTTAGKPLPNATSSTLVPFQTGRYYVIVTQNGCASPQSDLVTFVVTAISEPAGDLSVRVIPNPITDRLRLEIEQSQRQSVQVQLLDVSGRSVREYQIPAFAGKKQAEWPLAGIAPGHYLLKADTGSRQSVIRVLVE